MIDETYVMLNKIPDSFVDNIIQIGYDIGFKPSKVFEFDADQKGRIDYNIRSSHQAWVPQHQYKDLYSTVTDYFTFVNRINFNFDISHGVNEIQIVKYNSETKDHFNWHQDVIYEYPTTSRKISMTMQLSDPNTYEGGDLLIGNNIESFDELTPNLKAAKQKSSIIMFNSYLRHKVTPVTKGVRYSLIAWASGPPFR